MPRIADSFEGYEIFPQLIGFDFSFIHRGLTLLSSSKSTNSLFFRLIASEYFICFFILKNLKSPAIIQRSAFNLN